MKRLISVIAIVVFLPAVAMPVEDCLFVDERIEVEYEDVRATLEFKEEIALISLYVNGKLNGEIKISDDGITASPSDFLDAVCLIICSPGLLGLIACPLILIPPAIGSVGWFACVFGCMFGLFWLLLLTICLAG